MKIDFKAIFSKKENIVSTLLVLAVIIFIAFLFPTTGGFNSTYKNGEVWKHEDLLAPFEFPLLKSPEDIIKLKNKVRTEFVPYFKSTQKRGAVSRSILDFITNNNEEIGESSAVRIIQYIDSNKDKILISKEQLIIEGIPKSSFLIANAQGYMPYGKTKFLDLNEFHSTIIKEIPSELQEEIGKLMSTEVEIDLDKNKKELLDAEQKIIASDVSIKKGELIVSRGNLITENVHRKLDSLKDATSQKQRNFTQSLGSFLGHIILTFLILGALMLYLYFHFPFILRSPTELSFILLWIVLFTFLVFQIEKTPNLSSYVIPFCIAPIIIKTYYEERLALFVHIVIVLIASFLSSLGYEFTFLQILAGIVTVLLIEETRYWDRFFLSILIIMVTYFLGFWGLHMASTNSIGQGLDSSVWKWLVLNSVFILLAYPFIPLLSKLFGFTSSITLKEWADLSKPLLKDLSINAPGTFQHSLQVSNLSEAAAEKIGADSLLIKVAALYHDIGKLDEPMIFIENLGYGRNPHEDLTSFESAKKIIAHVEQGVKLAKSNGLPKEIISMIKSHHGTTKVEFFYRKQKQDHPTQECDETLFTYPGPKPITKEETILLLADSIEAASKSLKEPTAEDIDSLVDQIVQDKITHKQLSESKLTYNEMKDCKEVFKELLQSINHVRMKYPDKPQ